MISKRIQNLQRDHKILSDKVIFPKVILSCLLSL